MKKDFLREILGKIRNVYVLEEVENPQNVFEYIELAVKVKANIDKEQVLSRKDKLFDKDLSLDERKKLLIQLASVDDIQAYKTLEEFSKSALAQEVSDFVKIALQESRTLLQSSLLGEPSILITSGLGGKDDKLRYFAILYANEKKDFTSTQTQIIEKETKFIAEENDCEIEKIDFHGYFVILLLFIPYSMAPSDFLDNLIENINYLGNFISTDYILRNDKTLSAEESKNLIDKIYSGELKINQIDTFIQDIGLPPLDK